MMRSVLYAVVAAALLAQCFGTVAAQDDDEDGDDDGTNTGTYLAVAPKKVRPNLPYSVSVQILRSPEDVNVVLVEVRNYNNYSIGREIAKVTKGIPQTITIEKLSPVKLIEGSSYKVYLKAETESRSRVLFEKENFVEFDSKSLSLYIQTDKAIYKPGSTVRFRAIVLNPDLTPSSENITVKIMDSMGNVIKQFANKNLTKGVFSGNMDLSTEPPLGDWTIRVDTDSGASVQKSFSVEKYVLPKFEVTIKTPKFITFNDDLKVLVQAKYTYGKGVPGKARLTIEEQQILSDYSNKKKTVKPDSEEFERLGTIQRSVKLSEDGEASLTFTNELLKKQSILRDASFLNIKLRCTVTEDLTGIQQNGTAEVEAHRNDVRLEIVKQGETFKPGLGYSALVKLSQMDYSPLSGDFAKRVQIRTRFYNLTKEMEKSVKIIEVNDQGVGVFQVDTPANRTNLKIEARYDQKGKDYFANTPHYWSVEIPSARSPTDSFLQLFALQTKVPAAGQDIAFTVRATEALSTIDYVVMSRGYVVLSGQFTASGKEGKLNFETTPEMAPRSRLVVYALRAANQEVLVDAVDFKVDGLFRNKVSLDVDRNETQPGENVTFAVKADPGSFVGLLAVDQSVLLLKSGNDITEKMVQSEMAQYDSTNGNVGDFTDDTPQSDHLAVQKRSAILMPGWIRWTSGGQDASSVFDNAGLTVLTDALLYRYLPPQPPMPYYGGGAAATTAGFVNQIQEQGFAAPVAPEAEEVALRLESADAGGGGSAPPRVRSQFPETWIWFDGAVKNGSNEMRYEATAPDTITSWIASAFAVSGNTGLGIAPSTCKVTVFRPFFIRLNLPYSVKRSEKFALQVLVFNYMDKELNVTVTLKHDADAGFDFLQKDGNAKKEISKESKSKTYNVRVASVPGGGVSRAVYFPISPSKIGNVKLSVVAQSALAGDAIEELLKVEPEGYRVERNVPFVVELSSNSSSTGLNNFSKTVDVDIPSNAVEGSKRAQIDVIGDIMGPILSNVDSLVRVPYGCGEQNMINFVPNIVVVRYLRATKPNDELEAKAIRHMEDGYQRQLTYKRYDNSFSAFGQQDRFGSTWLTAFVVKSFKQAQPYIFIDGEVLRTSIAFLNSQQNAATGEFTERGRLVDRELQGASVDEGAPITAYVLIALLENGVKNRKAQEYLEGRLNSVKDNPYALAVVTYALQLAGSAKKDDALKMLEAHRILGDDGSVHWGKRGTREVPKGDVRYFYQPRPADVEMTAYALLSYLRAGQVAKGVPVVKWLSGQRNSLGGFSSTQDTVMALQALGTYAEKVYSPNVAVTVDVSTIDKADSHRFEVDNSNANVLQSFEIANPSSAVNVDARGSGVAFVQVHYYYHRVSFADDAPFTCSQNVTELHNGRRLQLKLCCSYTASNSTSNMAMAEIEALTGHQFDREETNRLSTSYNDVERAELEKGDTKLNLYYYSLGATTSCVTVFTDEVYEVTDQKPAHISVYDYYDPEMQVKLAYSAKAKRPLNETCTECWPKVTTAL